MRRLLAAAAVIAVPAGAEVVQSSPAGFEVSHAITVAAPPEKAWPTVTAPRLWWNKDHTYSDDPANLTLDERPGGCFCEKLPGKGGVEHMRVVYIQPPRMIRLTGGLGPLQAEGATGMLAITLTRDGDATRIVMTYVAGGYVRAGGDKLAPLMDRVLGLQLAGLKAALDGPVGGAAPSGAPVPPRIRAEPLADVGATISGLDPGGGPPAPAPAPAAPPKNAAKARPLPSDWDSPR